MQDHLKTFIKFLFEFLRGPGSELNLGSIVAI